VFAEIDTTLNTAPTAADPAGLTAALSGIELTTAVPADMLGATDAQRMQGGSMRSWDLKNEEAQPHQPRILSTADDARAILLLLPAGEELQEHEVHEHARLVVIDGEVDATTSDGDRVSATPGHMLEFEPRERHTVSARSDARLLLLLTPWPGDGHPGAMTLEQKAEVRERAAERSQSS
jgi:quercetin dioxygenase-like cupin family protein